MSKDFPVSIQMALTPRDVAESLTGDELVEFIKQVDLARGEWDVTLALCEHFENLKKVHEREEAEDRVRRAKKKESSSD